MLNLSKLISSIKMDLGVYGMALPFENPDEIFREVLELKTIPTFSQFQPYYLPLKLDLDTLKEIEKNVNYCIYEIPDVFGDAEILFVKKLEEDLDSFVHGYLDVGSMMGNMSWGDMMMGQANANLSSLAMPPVTFEYIAPNQIKIFNDSFMYSRKIRLEVALEHNKNLATISKTAQYSFTKLATLDIKMMLYNNLKHYNDLQTAFGNINLKIDDWANAESERSDLLRQWEETYHMDIAQFIII